MATPTKKEIADEALRIFMQDQAVKGFPGLANNKPEISELKEEGCFDKAKLSLMASKHESRLYDSFVDSVINDPEQRVHSSLALSEILTDIKNHLGVVICGEAGSGKSYTAFSLVKQAMQDKDLTVIVLSPSTTWRRNFGAIKFVKVGTSVFNPIVPIDETNLESVPWLRNTIHVNLDKRWIYVKSQWFEKLLESKQNLLFEIKYKNSRRTKHFESVVLKFIYDMQEQEIETDPNYKHHFLVVLEESQNSFGTYSMNSDDSLDLFTVFTQARSDANLHFVCIGQRLNDISTKIVERLRPLIGLTLGENSLRKLKAMIPDDETKKRIQSLPQRHWIYLDGKSNPEITIPTYEKEGTPIQCLPFDMPEALTLECVKKRDGFSFMKNWFNR